MKKFKCPFCRKEYANKNALYRHMEDEHENQIPQGISPARCYFNYRYGKTHGSCIICGKETKWNENSEKYERICSPKCQQKFRELFLARMKKAGKENQMTDPEHQKKMLAARKISGTFVWNNKYKFTYTGSYEKDFLRYMKDVLKWPPGDIMMPAPQVFKYYYEGKEHFYIPDVYIPSLNLIIEIKSETNTHYRARDIAIEKIKDSILEKSNHNYFKIYDKKYDKFSEFIKNLKNN